MRVGFFPLIMFAYSTARLLKALDAMMTPSCHSTMLVPWSPEDTPWLDWVTHICVVLVLNSLLHRSRCVMPNNPPIDDECKASDLSNEQHVTCDSENTLFIALCCLFCHIN